MKVIKRDGRITEFNKQKIINLQRIECRTTALSLLLYPRPPRKRRKAEQTSVCAVANSAQAKHINANKISACATIWHKCGISLQQLKIEDMRNSFASRQQMAAIKKSTEINRPYDDTNNEQEEPTPTCLLDAIEYVVDRAADCGLSSGFYKSVDASLEYLSSRLEMTKNEALLLSVAVNMGTDFRITLANIAEYFACTRIKVLKLAKDIDSLVERRYLRRVKMRERETTYTLHYEAVESIQNDKPYIRQPQSGLDAEQLFEEIHKLIRALKHHQIDISTFAEESELLITSNNHLLFCKAFKALDLQDNNKLILIKACDMLINQDDELIMFNDIDEMFESESVISRLHKDILNGTNELIRREILEQYPNGQFASRDVFQLTEKACTELLGEFGITKSFVETPTKNKNLTQPSDIFAKSLYYNPSEEQQISRLESLLQPDAFANITQRLADSGMRKGFACLFYGKRLLFAEEHFYRVGQSLRTVYGRQFTTFVAYFVELSVVGRVVRVFNYHFLECDVARYSYSEHFSEECFVGIHIENGGVFVRLVGEYNS